MNIRTIAIAAVLGLMPLSSMAFGFIPWEWVPNQQLITTGGMSGYYVDGYNVPREIFLVRVNK